MAEAVFAWMVFFSCSKENPEPLTFFDGDPRIAIARDAPAVPPRAGARDRYFLTIPSFFMRASSVVGFSPKASAAPPGPRTRQPVRSRMRKM
jgi:hypothetical protein